MIKCDWVRIWLSTGLCHPQLSHCVGRLLAGKCLVLVSMGFGGLDFTNVLRG